MNHEIDTRIISSQSRLGLTHFLIRSLTVLFVYCWSSTFTVQAQELWHNNFYHIFQGSNNFNPTQTLFDARNILRHDDKVTVLAKMWTGTINLDPEGSEGGLMETSLEPNAYRRLALIRYDTTGTFLWRKYISSFVHVNDPEPIGQISINDGVMAMDGSGNFHVFSAFFGQVDLSSDGSGAYIFSNPFGPNELLVECAYVARYDQEGTLLGSNVIASRNAPTGNIRARNVAAASDGSAYLLLSYDSEILVHTPDGDLSFGSRPEAPALYDVVLIKLDPNSEVEWVKHFAAETTGIPVQELAVDGNDNIVYAGRWSGNLLLNPDDPEGPAMATANNTQWGVFWSSFSPEGVYLAGDAYTRTGSLLNLRGMHVSPDGAVYTVLNDVGFNMLSSGEALPEPEGYWTTRVLKYAPDGSLELIKDNIPNGAVFADIQGNPAIVYANSIYVSGESYDFNAAGSETIIFDGYQGSYRVLLNYDANFNLTRAALLHEILSSGGSQTIPLMIGDNSIMFGANAAEGFSIVPDLNNDFSYTFDDKGFTFAKYKASSPLSSNDNILAQAATIKLYPNPVQDIFHLELAYPDEVAQVELISLEGKMLWSRSGMQSGLQIELKLALSNLPQGIYLLKSMQKGEQHSLKLVKVSM